VKLASKHASAFGRSNPPDGYRPTHTCLKLWNLAAKVQVGERRARMIQEFYYNHHPPIASASSPDSPSLPGSGFACGTAVFMPPNTLLIDMIS